MEMHLSAKLRRLGARICAGSTLFRAASNTNSAAERLEDFFLSRCLQELICHLFASICRVTIASNGCSHSILLSLSANFGIQQATCVAKSARSRGTFAPFGCRCCLTGLTHMVGLMIASIHCLVGFHVLGHFPFRWLFWRFGCRHALFRFRNRCGLGIVRVQII